MIDGSDNIHIHLSRFCRGDKLLQPFPETDYIFFCLPVIGHHPQE